MTWLDAYSFVASCNTDDATLSAHRACRISYTSLAVVGVATLKPFNPFVCGM
ncbi:hypothetical protein BaRGS_00012431, partial [Batillaria attramentaria]